MKIFDHAAFQAAAQPVSSSRR